MNKEVSFNKSAHGVVVGENNNVTILLPNGDKAIISKLNYSLFQNAFSKKINFIGREAEIKKIYDLVSSKEVEQTIIGVCGMAGVGKSSLVLQIACDLATNICKGGILWADFPTHGGTIQPILYTWAQLCEQQEILEIPSTEIQIQALKSALTTHSNNFGRFIAVFDDVRANTDQNWIDNMHLLHKALPDNCIILITSRQNNIPLSLRATEIIVLSPLDEHSAAKLVGKLNPKASVADSRKIASFIGGLPLGIEIASSLSKLEGIEWTINALSNKDNIIDFLTIGDSNRKDDSILNSFKISFDTLPFELSRFYLSLSVFAEGDIELTWLEDFVVILWGEEAMNSFKIRKIIRDLAGRNLLSKSEHSIKIHPLIKEALNKIVSNQDTDQAVCRNAYVSVFHRIATHANNIDDFEKPLNNIIRSLDFAQILNKEECIIDIIRCIAVENKYLHRRGMWDIAIDLLNKGIASAKKINSPSYLGLLNEKGVYLREMGNYSDAESIFKDIIRIGSYNDDKESLAIALVNLGHLLMYSRDYENALKNLDYSISISEQINNSKILGQSYLSKARVYVGQGDTETGRNYALKSLEFLETIKELRLIVFVKRVIGRTYAIERNFELAKKFYEESLNSAIELKDIQSQAYIMRGLGDLYVDFDKDSEAIECFVESEKTFSLIKDYAALSATLCSLGELHLKFKDNINAKNSFEKGFSISVEERWRGRCLFGLAKTNYYNGNQEDAKMQLEKAIEIVKKTNHRDIKLLENWKSTYFN